MSTLSTMRSRIADDLNRTDLNTQIDLAINRAINHYESMLTWFNEAIGDVTTVDGQQFYMTTTDGPSNNVAIPSDIREIIDIHISDANGNNHQLTPRHIQYIWSINTGHKIIPITAIFVTSTDQVFTSVAHGLSVGDRVLFSDITTGTFSTSPHRIWTVATVPSTTGFTVGIINGTADAADGLIHYDQYTGMPTDWAWYNDRLYLYPTPDDAYSVTIRYHKSYSDLSADGDSNDWSNNAEDLIEARALWWINKRLLRNHAEAGMHKEMEMEALKALHQRSTQQLSTGSLRASNF